MILGFNYRELSYLNEEFSQGHFNQVIKEGINIKCYYERKFCLVSTS
jgi:hypothetical protein